MKYLALVLFIALTAYIEYNVLTSDSFLEAILSILGIFAVSIIAVTTLRYLDRL